MVVVGPGNLSCGVKALKERLSEDFDAFIIYLNVIFFMFTTWTCCLGKLLHVRLADWNRGHFFLKVLRHLAYLFLIILSDCRSCSCFPCFWFPVARLFHSINSYLSLYITHRAFEMTANFNQSEETDCWKKQRSTTTISLDVVNSVATAMSSSQRFVFV